MQSPWLHTHNPLAPTCRTAGSKVCTVCPAGTVTGLTPTNAPANGTRGVLRLGYAAVAAYRCDDCPTRTFRPSIWSANYCTPCPKGRETKRFAAATMCNACPPGFALLQTTNSKWDIACSACRAGEAGQARGLCAEAGQARALWQPHCL